MSTIGGGGLGFGPLPSAAAGVSGQQRTAGGNQTAAEAAERKFQLDQQALTEQTVADVGESNETDDRDADGRLPWQFSRRKPGGPSITGSVAVKAPDPNHERGGQLDLDA